MRLFIAITLSQSLRDHLTGIQDSLASAREELRFTSPENLHLTLKFLGEVPDAKISQVLEILRKAGSECSCFTMALFETGCFPERGGVRIVWAGLKEDTGVLANCATLLEDEYQSLGFEKESRAFSPHITIARVRKNSSPRNLREIVSGLKPKRIEQHVTHLSLMRSVLQKSGASYELIEEVELGET